MKKRLIDYFPKNERFLITHLWKEDDGYWMLLKLRKNNVLHEQTIKDLKKSFSKRVEKLDLWRMKNARL